jgi:HAD superfamily hydrolase (TIGR01509 family)
MGDAALLFDLDGTLIDSDPLHARIFVDLFAERGIEIDEAFYLARIHGRHNTDIFREFLPDEDPFEMHLTKEAAFRDKLPPEVPAMPGVAALIERARSRGARLAVVTNAPRLNADAMLRATGLAPAFDTVIVGEECNRGKPDPAPYRAAMEALAVHAEDALAFEDSPSGLASARAAGIYTVGIQSSLTDANLRDAGAHATLKDFTDPALEPLLERLEGALT